MKRQVLDCGGSDFDFIITDSELRIYAGPYDKIYKVIIKRSLLLELFEQLPLTELKKIEEQDELPF